MADLPTSRSSSRLRLLLAFFTQSRYKIRVVSARAYHCLFMHNMLIRPTEAELASFGRPDFTIFNAGAFPCNRYTSYMTSSSSVDVNLKVRCSLMLWPQHGA